MRYAKLDLYNYDILSDTIRIKLCGVNDPDLVDIMSEINKTDGHIYVEGKRYQYLNSYTIDGPYDKPYIDLKVRELRQ